MRQDSSFQIFKLFALWLKQLYSFKKSIRKSKDWTFRQADFCSMGGKNTVMVRDGRPYEMMGSPSPDKFKNRPDTMWQKYQSSEVLILLDINFPSSHESTTSRSLQNFNFRHADYCRKQIKKSESNIKYLEKTKFYNSSLPSTPVLLNYVLDTFDSLEKMPYNQINTSVPIRNS